MGVQTTAGRYRDWEGAIIICRGELSIREVEYSGLMAQAWDVLRGDTSDWPDRPFYLELIQTYSQPVLDVGCGTGRLLLDYLQNGIDIDGVDNSPEMLAICKQKADDLELTPNLYEQNMETLELPRQYGTILVPSSSLQLIIEPSEVDQVPKRFANHLMPSGVVAASIMALWKEGDPLESAWAQSATRQKDGVTFRRVSTLRYDPESECEDTEDSYQMIVDEEVVSEETNRRSPATRSYNQRQVKAVLENAGFTKVQLTSGFTFDPVRADDTVFAVIGQRPEEGG